MMTSLRDYLQAELLKINAAHETNWIAEWVDRQASRKSDARKLAEKVISRRLMGEPLAYIFGSWAFREFEFFCGPGVLIPRPETEELVDLAVNFAKNLEQKVICVADFGAGTGCLGISIVRELLKIKPKTLIHLICVERESEALRYLKKNLERHLNGYSYVSYEVKEASWNDCQLGTVDLFVSNPPYISEVEYQSLEASVKSFEPKTALVPSNDPNGYSAYEELLGIATRSAPQFIGFELGTFQFEWILSKSSQILPQYKAHIELDMARKPRFFIGERL